MNITKEQETAAGEMIELIAGKFGTNRQIHPATAISAGARLAGSFIFRSFNLDLKDLQPGAVVLTEQANQTVPILISVLGGTLLRFGLNLDKETLDKSPMADSNLPFLETLQRIQDKALEIMLRNKLDYRQMANSCAMATAFIIKECATDLLPETGFNTAIYGFIEGSKTCPPALKNDKPETKNFFKFWK